MKKVSAFLMVIVILSVLCSCSMNKSCPAYADNSETTEQNV